MPRRNLKTKIVSTSYTNECKVNLIITSRTNECKVNLSINQMRQIRT